MSELQIRQLMLMYRGWAAASSLGSGCSSVSHNSYCSPSSAAGMFLVFGLGGSGITVPAPQSGHLTFLPTLSEGPWRRVPHTRHSKPTSCGGLAAGRGLVAVSGTFFAEASFGGDFSSVELSSAGTTNGS